MYVCMCWWMDVYICMYACMYLCMWMYVCMYVCIDGWMDGCVYMYVCMYVFMYVDVRLYVYVCMYVCTYVCMYVCVCGWMDVCMYVRSMWVRFYATHSPLVRFPFSISPLLSSDKTPTLLLVQNLMDAPPAKPNVSLFSLQSVLLEGP